MGANRDILSIFEKDCRCVHDVRNVPHNGGQHNRWAEESRRYLSMFSSIGMVFSLYYLVQALTLGTHKLAVVHSISFLSMLLAKLLSGRVQSLRWGIVTFLIGLNNLVVLSSVFDGLIRAHGLWFIAALPMASTFLWSQRATLVVSIIALLEIPLIAWVDHRFEIQREIESFPGIMFIMMLFMIFVFSLFSFLYTSRTHAKIEILKSETSLLEEANRESLHAFEEKQIFLAKMSHEIRTPMNGLLGCVRELEGRNELFLRKLTQGAQQNAANLMIALDVCLDRSQSAEMSYTRRHVQSEPVDLSDCLSQAAQKIGRLPLWESIKVKLDIQPIARRAEVDIARLHLLLLNIASSLAPNPAFSTPVMRAETISSKTSDCTWLKIQFGEESAQDCSTELLTSGSDARDLFRTSIDSGDVNLAIAVSFQLMREMRATPLVTNDTFGHLIGVKLPLVCAEEESEPVQAFRKTPLVLVVDDNAINLKVASLLLERAGCNVVLAENGSEAVAKAEERTFDLILMDMRMPVMDGLEATQKIISTSPLNALTPIVAVTANAYESDRRACLEAGMVEHLAKPLKPSALRQVLQRYVYAVSSASELRCA